MEGNGKAVAAEAAALAGRADVDVVPTAPEEPDLLRSRRARTVRRLFMLGLAAVVGLGATNVLGVRSRSMTVSGGGYELTVTYGQVSRPGLATPWSLEIRHPGGFDGPVHVAVNGRYLDLFDENGLDPDPSSTTATADHVIWEFDPPPGDTLGVSFDARIEPGAQWGRTGETSVLVDGRPVVTARYKTWLLP